MSVGSPVFLQGLALFECRVVFGSYSAICVSLRIDGGLGGFSVGAVTDDSATERSPTCFSVDPNAHLP